MKSFGYKKEIIGTTSADNNFLDTEVVVLLKYLRDFLRFLNLPLINCEVELICDNKSNASYEKINNP